VPQTELALFTAAGALTLDPDTWAPAGVTGPAKVGQRVLYVLNTPRGSVPGLPAFGTDLAALISGYRSDFDLFAAFAAIVGQLAASCAAAEGDETGLPAERFGGIKLMSVASSAGVAEYTMAVVAADGSVTPPLTVTVSV
jgi:hypothetical protein